MCIPLCICVSDWWIKFCVPLSGSLIELPPCGPSSCSFWSQQATVVNWSVMGSTAGKVRQSALLMHSPCQNLYTTHLATFQLLSWAGAVSGSQEALRQSSHFISSDAVLSNSPGWFGLRIMASCCPTGRQKKKNETRTKKLAGILNIFYLFIYSLIYNLIWELVVPSCKSGHNTGAFISSNKAH